MDFTLDQKHEMARDLFKQFAETEVKPFCLKMIFGTRIQNI